MLHATYQVASSEAKGLTDGIWRTHVGMGTCDIQVPMSVIVIGC